MSDSTGPKPGSLWARIMGVREADEAAPPPPEVSPIEPSDDALSFDESATDPSPTVKIANVQPPIPEFARNPLEKEPEAMPAAPLAAVAVAVPVALPPCSSCGAPRKLGLAYCDDCGYHFPNPSAIPLAAPVGPSAPAGNEPVGGPERLNGRFLLGALASEKMGVGRFAGLDASVEPPLPVVVVRASLDDEPIEAVAVEAVAVAVEDELLPTFDGDLLAASVETVPLAEIQGLLGWPRPSWEKDLLQRVAHPALPKVVDSFVEGKFEVLVLERPTGQSLWDAWDDPDADAETRYGWLVEIAEAVDAIHKAGAIFECLSPDRFVVDERRRIRFVDVGDLLPLPIPMNAPLRGTLYTPPELLSAPESVDPRASLYSLGAILYSLEYLHHGLEETDFESKSVPKQITDRFPDVHPLFARLVNKTFVKDPNARFPTDEASRVDATGLREFIQSLEVCRRTFDGVRLDVAAWTTTGMVRTGNEDAFAVLHGVDARQDDLHEYSLILLCDGMGGYDAGEVAAALAIQSMKSFFLQQPMFSALAGKDGFPGPIDVDAAKKLFEAGLKHANKEVFTASRTPGKGKRGMGCTAEAVYVDSRNVVVGHVGDSRVYHLKEGRLVQLTRDQTLVNRLVELGQLKPEEAEDHPRKNELQQAIGGQPDVNPAVYHSRLKRGDWVLVCSDGLSNHIGHQELEKMLTREVSNSSEEAARRLLNLVNLRGATDNATVVVVRAT